MKHARELKAGDVFRLNVFYEVTSVIPVGDGGKRVLIGIKPEDQSELEFFEGRAFFCRASRTFAVYGDEDDGDEMRSTRLGKYLFTPAKC